MNLPRGPSKGVYLAITMPRRLATWGSALFLMACGWLVPDQVRSAEVSVAAAANFAAPLKALAQAFERESGHRVRASTGSTGALYAQVTHGAPFQVFLSADDQTPARLEAEGRAVAGTRFTYAIGRLALWSPQPGRVDGQGQVLRSDSTSRLAIANPKLAPYGAAALEVLERLEVSARWQARLVQGENMAQAHQFVSSGNAALGFVALSQVMQEGRWVAGSGWLVPAHLHRPLRQDAVLLQRGAHDAAAVAFLSFLRGESARRIIASFGYEP